MVFYRIEWKATALKELKKLPKGSVVRVLKAIDALKENPFPLGSKKLAGGRSAYRIREGVYRVIYSVFEDQLVIEVVKVGHRKDVYK